MDWIGKHIENFCDNELKQMPLGQESVKADKSVSLGFKKLLGFLFCGRPLHQVAFGVQRFDHKVDAEEEWVGQHEAIRVEVLLRAFRVWESEAENAPKDTVHE